MARVAAFARSSRDSSSVAEVNGVSEGVLSAATGLIIGTQGGGRGGAVIRDESEVDCSGSIKGGAFLECGIGRPDGANSVFRLAGFPEEGDMGKATLLDKFSFTLGVALFGSYVNLGGSFQPGSVRNRVRYDVARCNNWGFTCRRWWRRFVHIFTNYSLIILAT